MSKHKKKQKKHERHFEQPVVVDQPGDRGPDVLDEETAKEFAGDDVEFGNEAPGLAGDDMKRTRGGISGDDVEFGEERIGDLREEEEVRPVDKNEDVEAAAEVSPVADPVMGGRERDERRPEAKARDEGHGIGTIAIILSVLAFFLVPFLLGPAGIVLGIISARRGSRLGWWAVALGAMAIILTAFIAPIAGF